MARPRKKSNPAGRASVNVAVQRCPCRHSSRKNYTHRRYRHSSRKNCNQNCHPARTVIPSKARDLGFCPHCHASRHEFCPQKRKRPGPATQAASYVISCSALSPHGGGMTALARQHSHKERTSATFAKGQLPIRRSFGSNLAIRPCDPKSTADAVASGPIQLRRAGGRRPQCRETPVRACARFRNLPSDSPSRIADCRWLCRNHSTSSGTHVFAEPTLSQIVASRNTKTLLACAEAVEDETSLWKHEEN